MFHVEFTFSCLQSAVIVFLINMDLDEPDNEHQSTATYSNDSVIYDSVL